MNFIPIVVAISEIAIATIILWYVVDLLTAMPANMRMVVKCLIVLVAILVVLSMFVGQPMHVGIPAAPPSLVRQNRRAFGQAVSSRDFGSVLDACTANDLLELLTVLLQWTDADCNCGIPMTNEPTDWHQALARVSGELVRGEQRVTTHELLTVHLGIPVTDRTCRRLRRVMRELGWRGPRRMRWGTRLLNGYWRHPTAGLPEIMHEEPAAEIPTVKRGTLAPELEAVARQGLKKLGQILALPTDRSDANLLRAQTSAAATALNTQLRVDETKLRQQQSQDTLERLLQIIAREEQKLEQSPSSDSAYSPKPSQN